MAIKTFTTGEVLTASDTNTYLANAGLVYVTSTTIGTAVSSVTITNCFSATYDNYRIVVNGGAGSAAQAIAAQFGPASVGGYNTEYYQILYHINYATTAATALNVNNGASWSYVGESADNQVCAFDILSPYQAKYASVGGFYMGTVGGWVAGRHASTGQFTDIKLTVAGTMTGGTVTVYGYRKA